MIFFDGTRLPVDEQQRIHDAPEMVLLRAVHNLVDTVMDLAKGYFADRPRVENPNPSYNSVPAPKLVPKRSREGTPNLSHNAVPERKHTLNRSDFYVYKGPDQLEKKAPSIDQRTLPAPPHIYDDQSYKWTGSNNTPKMTLKHMKDWEY